MRMFSALYERLPMRSPSEPLVSAGGPYAEPCNVAQGRFQAWGVWAVLVAGFSAIPYKVFTLAAGVPRRPLLAFAIASVMGRGARFLLVAARMSWGGERMEGRLREYVDRVGWSMALLAMLVVSLR